MVFPDSEDVESNLVGVFDLLNQVAQALCWTQRPTGLIVRCREAINAELHHHSSDAAVRHRYVRTGALAGRRRKATLTNPPTTPRARAIHVSTAGKCAAIPSNVSSEYWPKPVTARPSAAVA